MKQEENSMLVLLNEMACDFESIPQADLKEKADKLNNYIKNLNKKLKSAENKNLLDKDQIQFLEDQLNKKSKS